MNSRTTCWVFVILTITAHVAAYSSSAAADEASTAIVPEELWTSPAASEGKAPIGAADDIVDIEVGLTAEDLALIEKEAKAAHLDLDKILDAQKKHATKQYKELKREKPRQKAKKKAARHAFKEGRKELRHNFKKCKKTITKKNPTLDSSLCRIFRTSATYAEASLVAASGYKGWHLDSTGEVKTGKMLELGKSKGKARREARHAKRHKKRSLKHNLRVLRRKRRRQLRATWKKAKKAYKSFKKKLRGAKFKCKILPKVLTLLKPKIEGALAKVDMGNGGAGAGAGVVATLDADAIKVKRVLKNYLDMALHKKIDPLMEKVFDKIKTLLKDVLDPVVEGLKDAMVASVGSVPFVGGVLAVVVSKVFDVLFGAIKQAIGRALDKVQELLQDKIVDAIVGVCFTTMGKFVRNVRVATSAGTHASSAVTHSVKKGYAQSTAKAERGVHQAKVDISQHANDASDSLAETHHKDEDVDKDENAADDDDDSDGDGDGDDGL